MLGVDVHKRVCQAAILDKDGELIEEARFMNSRIGDRDLRPEAHHPQGRGKGGSGVLLHIGYWSPRLDEYRTTSHSLVCKAVGWRIVLEVTTVL